MKHKLSQGKGAGTWMRGGRGGKGVTSDAPAPKVSHCEEGFNSTIQQSKAQSIWSFRYSLPQAFSDGLAKLCDERFDALLAGPRGSELLDLHPQTAGSSLATPSALQGKAALDTISANESAQADQMLDIG